MGIDIYARWKTQTLEEKEAQYTGYSVVHGHVGYLREAYHGKPYATKYLCQEAFASDENAAPIPAALLRERLSHTLMIVEQRARDIYHETDPATIAEVQQSFSDFVDLCERKEAETGEAVTIIVS